MALVKVGGEGAGSNPAKTLSVAVDEASPCRLRATQVNSPESPGEALSTSRDAKPSSQRVL